MKAAVTDSTVSALINEMVREQLAEDVEDLREVRERAGEPVISYDELLEELRAHGKI